MIDYIKYRIDGKTYGLINNGDGTWTRNLNAPSVAGLYTLVLEVGQQGIVTYIDSGDPRYNFYLNVILSAERIIYLQDYVPIFMSETRELKELYDIENIEFDKLYGEIEKIKSDMFISTASIDSISRIETFMRIKGQGSLEQRKSYIMSLMQKGNKLSEKIIRDLTNTITGSDCIVMFFSADDLSNPEVGNSILRIQVLSPENNKDYRYEDIAKAIKPLVPAHIKLVVVKFFATWGDIKVNFTDWNTVKSMTDWEAVKSYIPPQ